MIGESVAGGMRWGGLGRRRAPWETRSAKLQSAAALALQSTGLIHESGSKGGDKGFTVEFEGGIDLRMQQKPSVMRMSFSWRLRAQRVNRGVRVRGLGLGVGRRG